MATIQQAKPKKKQQGPKSSYGKWIAKKRAQEIQKWGGACQVCGNITYEELEFAHVIETELSGDGQGRGSYRRWKDVRDHPECYRLMCYLCHEVFDNEKENEKVQGIYRQILKLAEVPDCIT